MRCCETSGRLPVVVDTLARGDEQHWYLDCDYTLTNNSWRIARPYYNATIRQTFHECTRLNETSPSARWRMAGTHASDMRGPRPVAPRRYL
jgi:hypothetical protein